MIWQDNEWVHVKDAMQTFELTFRAKAIIIIRSMDSKRERKRKRWVHSHIHTTHTHSYYSLHTCVLNYQHVHSAYLAFFHLKTAIVRTIPLRGWSPNGSSHSIKPYTCRWTVLSLPLTLLTLFDAQQSLLSYVLRTKYYFGEGQAFIRFGGSLMHGTDFHVHSSLFLAVITDECSE